jgi:hypothetical protein
MKKYKARTLFSPMIECLEVVSQTNRTITYMDGTAKRRENLISQDHRWFDDFAPAKAFLIGYFGKMATWANERLATAQAIEAPHD